MKLLLQKITLIVVITMAMSTFIQSARAVQPLTESESLRLGFARPELAELSHARVEEARADALETSRWINPTLEYSRDNSRNNAGIREQTWQLSQPVDFSGRRNLKRDAGAQRIIATEAEARHVRADRTLEIRRSFFQLLLHEQQLKALDTWMKRLVEVERVVGKLRNAGEVSGYEVRRLARERQAAEMLRAEKNTELEQVREQFAAMLEIEVAASEGLVGNLLPDLPSGLEALLVKLDTQHDLEALRARAVAADLDGRAAARGWIPEVTLGMGAKRSDNGLEHETLTSFTAAIPLPIFDRQQLGQRRAMAQAMAARAEYSLTRNHAEGQLRGLHRQVTQLINLAERFRGTHVQSDDLVRIADAAYRAGESTILELLDAYKGALETETSLLDIEWKARAASIELDKLTGGHHK